jgi:hypothetical protein
MKVILIKNEFTDSAVQYVLNIIMSQAGFFHEWTDHPAPPASFIIEYAPQEQASHWQQPALILPCIVHPKLIKQTELPWSEIQLEQFTVPVIGQIENSRTQPDSTRQTIPFDLIASIYFHLTRLEESQLTNPDQLTDEAVQSHLLWRYGQFKIPVVDILVDWFASLLAERIKMTNRLLIRLASFPGGENFGAAITHDVDFVRAYHPLKKLIIKLPALLGLKNKAEAEQTENRDRQFWGFDGLLDTYRHRNLQAAFFFIARYREGLHTRYEISQPKFAELFKTLNNSGHETGFHPSRFAFEHPRRYHRELSRLGKLSGNTVRGMRHHYLRGLIPQLWEQAEQLGLRYDSTLGYRRNSGFRAGTTRPFPVFSHRQYHPIDLIEFPLSFFENTLPEQASDPETALNMIRELMQETARRHGLLTALWHTNHIMQPPHYQIIWNRFLDLLQAERPFITTLAGHQNWQELRRKVQLDRYADSTESVFVKLTFPSGAEKLTLLIEPRFRDAIISNVAIKMIRNEGMLTLSDLSGHDTVSLEFLR